MYEIVKTNLSERVKTDCCRGCRPNLVAVDDILFQKPVEIGSLLLLSSQVGAHVPWFNVTKGSYVIMIIVLPTTATSVVAFPFPPVQYCSHYWRFWLCIIVCFVCRCATHRANTSRSEFTARCLTPWPASTTLQTSSTSHLYQTGMSLTSCPKRMEVSTHTQTHKIGIGVECCSCWLYFSNRVHVVLGWKETFKSHCWTVKEKTY